MVMRYDDTTGLVGQRYLVDHPGIGQGLRPSSFANASFMQDTVSLRQVEYPKFFMINDQCRQVDLSRHHSYPWNF